MEGNPPTRDNSSPYKQGLMHCLYGVVESGRNKEVSTKRKIM